MMTEDGNSVPDRLFQARRAGVLAQDVRPRCFHASGTWLKTPGLSAPNIRMNKAGALARGL
jgi:hypothetical protein